MIQIYAIEKGEFRRLARNEDFLKVRKNADLLWIAAINPTLDEQNLLGEFLGVDSKSLIRVFEQASGGRYHRFYDLSAFHVPVMLSDPIIHVNVALVILGSKLVVTIGDEIPMDAISEVEDTVRNLVSMNQVVTPSIIAVRTIQEIIERNTKVIQHVTIPARELEEKFAIISIDALLEEIQRLRYLQGELFRHITVQRHLIDLMMQHVPRHLKLDEELRTFLGTAQAELERQQQTLEINSRGLTDLVSLHSVLLATRLNRIIVILTAITFTIAVPSLVANIFGMYALFSQDPIFIFPGPTPIFAWQIQLAVLIPAIVLPLLLVFIKGWIRASSPSEKRVHK